MRTKVIKDLSFTVCQMFFGKQLEDDLSQLSELPVGTLEIDILKGTTQHSDYEKFNLKVTNSIHKWFLEQLSINQISLEYIKNAIVSIKMDNTLNQNDFSLWKLDWNCSSLIETKDKTYSSNYGLPSKHLPMP